MSEAADALGAFLTEHLPGCKVTTDEPIEYNGGNLCISIRPPAARLSADLDTVMVPADALTHFAQQLVERMRRQAIEDYGLAPELEAARREAAAAEHRRLRKILDDYVRDLIANASPMQQLEGLSARNVIANALRDVEPPAPMPWKGGDDLERAERAEHSKRFRDMFVRDDDMRYPR